MAPDGILFVPTNIPTVLIPAYRPASPKIKPENFRPPALWLERCDAERARPSSPPSMQGPSERHHRNPVRLKLFAWIEGHTHIYMFIY